VLSRAIESSTEGASDDVENLLIVSILTALYVIVPPTHKD